ncbi:hypothetical protein PC39_07494 [Salinisphaera sp. PC39]|uniref:nuclear transport factor 2 family protein n=1 Tax=Salinisphaera sp. PC39 TaxID=1304156 RepID=UPI0033423D04
MAAFPRQHYIDMVEKHYFGNVDRKNMQAVLDCFQEDGSLTVQTAPITHEGRDAGVREMFQTLFDSYQVIWHGNFEHTVDVENECIATRFDVRLVDHDGGEVELHNCNFWYCRDGKFQRVYVFMSGENVLR